jgi:transporter family protein
MSWIPPTVGYIVLVGALGVTSKYALRSLSWQEVMLWTAVAYAVTTVLLVATGTSLRFHTGLNGGMAAVTAIIAPLSLCLLYSALRDGEVTRVIPVSSVYPLVTAVLALLVLNEHFSVTRVVGTAFVVVGVVLLTL